MLLTFCVCLAAMLAIFATLYQLELVGKRLDAAAARAAGGARVILAVTMTEVKYVAAAYLVVFLFVLAYLLIHATKLARLEREVAELAELGRRERERWLSSSSGRRCWPTARRRVAFAGSVRGPGRSARLGTWGVRLGWLLQTALLGVAGRARRGLPVGDAGPARSTSSSGSSSAST